MILTKFFRWLYNPNESDQRKRITPPCMQGVKKLPRKEKTRYKHVDMWDAREHAIFLKYCPDKRDRCYHAMAIDTSARPHELLNLQISDLGIELYKIISNIDTNIRVCFLTGYDINVTDYPDLSENKTKILIKPVYLSQLLQVIQTLLNDDYS